MLNVNDSILVLVPYEYVFYAQKIRELEFYQTYTVERDFEKIENIFTRVKTDSIIHYKPKAISTI